MLSHNLRTAPEILFGTSIIAAISVSLQIVQDAWLDLLELVTNFAPDPLFQLLAAFADSEPSRLRQGTVTEVLSMGLWPTAGGVHKCSAAVFACTGKEELVDPEDPCQNACDLTRKLTASGQTSSL